MRNLLSLFGDQFAFSDREKRLIRFAELTPEQRGEYQRRSVEDLQKQRQTNLEKIEHTLDPDAKKEKLKEDPAARERAMEAARRVGSDTVRKYNWRGHTRYRPESPDGRPFEYRYNRSGLYEQFQESDGSWTRGRTLRTREDVLAEGERHAAEREREAAMEKARLLRGLIMQREMQPGHPNNEGFRRYQRARDLGMEPLPTLELPSYRYVDSSGASTRYGVLPSESTASPSRQERVEAYRQELANGPYNTLAREFRAERTQRLEQIGLPASPSERFPNMRLTRGQYDAIGALRSQGYKLVGSGYDKFDNGYVFEDIGSGKVGVHFLPKQGGAINIGAWTEQEVEVAAKNGQLLKADQVAALEKQGFKFDELSSNIDPKLTKNLVSAIDRARNKPMNEKQRKTAEKLVEAIAPFLDPLNAFAEAIVKDGPESDSVKNSVRKLNEGLTKNYGIDSVQMKRLLRFRNSIPAVKDPTTGKLFALSIDAQNGFIFREVSPGEKKVTWTPERLAKLFKSFADEKTSFEDNRRMDEQERRVS